MKDHVNLVLKVWRGEESESRDRFVLSKNDSGCCCIEVRWIDTLEEP